jgi:shikimate kinase
MLGFKQNVFLIGPMGAGKTTVGKALAKELGYTFYDSDQEIEVTTGVDIAWIFDVEGEAGFREREVGVIDRLSQLTGIVLATGGGVVEREENCRVLASRGLVVYLQASVGQQLERTIKDRRRPLLQTDDKESKLKELIERRHQLYKSVADYEFSTDSCTIKSVVNDILAVLSDNSES